MHELPPPAAAVEPETFRKPSQHSKNVVFIVFTCDTSDTLRAANIPSICSSSSSSGEVLIMRSRRLVL